MKYFSEGFYNFYENKDEELEKADLSEEFLQLLPDQMKGVGEEIDFSVKQKISNFLNITKKVNYDVEQ